jgi:flagellar hook assembly protein FlgD
MKRHWTKKAFWQSLVSVIVLGVFIFLAVGSVDDLMDMFYPKISVKRDNRGNGVFEETETHKYSGVKYINGSCDRYERWQGPVTIRWCDEKGVLKYTEEVNMIEGLRNGESKTTFSDGRVVIKLYDKGKYVTQLKGASNSKADNSAFNILATKYSWFLYTLNVFDFDTAYVKSYMDTFETKLGTYAYDIAKFDQYYGDVTNELEETPYDSIISKNSELTLFQGLAEIKNSEFRLAIIDHYRSAGSTTFNIISTSYPGYLLNLNELGVNNEDFKVFCQDMDSRMAGYGALDLQDPFFVDSLDARMFRAIQAISNAGKSSSLLAESSVNSMFLNYKIQDINDIYDAVIQMLKSSFSKSTPKEVATIVVNDMLWQYYIPAEIIRQAVIEAYFIKGGVKRIPIATTGFLSNNSATSVTLRGNVIEDGGAAVTSRGIAWATFYAPTTTANIVNSGTGTGNFQVTLNGLTPGTTYYARTYATNSAGTAYGNTVSFVASITTDVNDIKLLNSDFTIYPNPASSLTTFSFKVESAESIMLTIIDMKGKVVLTKDLGDLSQGENQVMLNLSLLQNGMYICQLTKGTAKVTQKLIISH